MHSEKSKHALRMAKTPQSFGHSKCSRVKNTNIGKNLGLQPDMQDRESGKVLNNRCDSAK